MAQAWLVLEITNSTFYVGLVNAIPAFVVMVLSAFGGVLADRFGRRSIAIGGRFIVAVVSLIAAYLVATGLLQVWYLLVMGLILGVGLAVSNPASQTVVMDLVGRDRMISASSLNTTVSNLGTMLGPAIGGVLVAAYGHSSVFILIAAISTFSCFALLGLPRVPSRASTTVSEWRSVNRDMIAGITYTIKTPRVRWLLFTIAGALYWGAIQPIIPLYARDVLLVGSAGYGLLLGISGAGSMVTAIILFFAGDLPHKGLMVIASTVVVSVSYSLFAISKTFPISLVIMGVGGVGGGVWMTTTFALLQTAVENDMRGRVMGLALAVLQFFGFGFLFGGFLAETMGAALTLHVMAAAWFLSGLLTFVRSPDMRRLN
jgi:MFS family permease